MSDPSLLLVHPDAAALAEAMQRAVPTLTATPATSLRAARAHLVGSSFDAVLALAHLPDGPSASLLELDIHVPPLLVVARSEEEREEAERAGAAFSFVADSEPVVLAAVAAWHLGAEPDPPGARGGDVPPASAMQDVSDELARFTHAINNPLAVVVGNAQLVRELYGLAPDDEMIPSSLSDIETAAREIVALVEEVQALRRRIDEAA